MIRPERFYKQVGSDGCPTDPAQAHGVARDGGHPSPVHCSGEGSGCSALQRGKAAMVANRVSVLHDNFLEMYHFLS